MTKATKASDIKRDWHLIDLKGKVLGREASHIAQLLMGKGKSYFVRNLDCGDYVVVVNAKEVSVTGKKEGQKIYYRYSGYPGGLTQESLERLRKRKPEEVIFHAVKGMLPQNRLRDTMLKRLKVFKSEQHTFEDKFSVKAKKESEK
jgi:large subunit ribosomal protein L13